MSSPNIEYINEYIKIPPIFYCHATQKPFEECLICKKELLNTDTQYVIEKAFRRYPEFTAKDVVSEYALCLTCNTEVQGTLSVESRRLINNYFNQKVDLVYRRQTLLRDKGLDIDAWLNDCLIYQTPLSELTEYQIYAHCEGNFLIFSAMPFMISGQAIGEIAEHLSVETKEVLDNFINQYFGLPPELKKALKRKTSIHF